MKRRYIALCFILIVFITAVWAVLNDFENSKKQYRENKVSMLASKIDAAAESLSEFSQYVYDRQINTAAVTSIVSDAWKSSDQNVRDKKRRELHTLLKEDYLLMTHYNFRQVHFQFPDNTSFLRMHSPDKYGDDLSAMRPTIRLANERLQKMTAFEEGRIFNGYRIVYPLFHNGRHCGAVELSFSMKAFTEILSNIDENTYLFAVKKDFVKRVVFEQDQQRYVNASFSDDYMFDVEVMPKVSVSYDFLKGNPFFEHLLQTASDGSFFVTDDSQAKMVLVQHIKNVNGNAVAALIAISSEQTLAHLKRDTVTVLVMVGVIFLLSYFALYLLLRERDSLQHLAGLDILTGLANRITMYSKIQHEIARYRRYGRDFCIIMIDIDNFKKINDSYGHAEGDRVLANFAALLQKNIRSIDTAARWGGEEFLVLVPEASPEQGKETAEKICRVTKESKICEHQNITVSTGYAPFMSADTADTVISRADSAMYDAKNNGKNRAAGAQLE